MQVGDRVLAVKGVHVATAAMATEVLSKHTSSSPPWISLNLVCDNFIYIPRI